MNGRKEIEQRREQIAAVCREHEVARLLVFGSVLRDDFDPETSDIDFLVEFKPGINKGWLSEYTDLKHAMEGLFGRKVDVVRERGVINPYILATVEREKVLLYAA